MINLGSNFIENSVKSLPNCADSAIANSIAIPISLNWLSLALKSLFLVNNGNLLQELILIHLISQLLIYTNHIIIY
jgi:hypothetical protein